LLNSEKRSLIRFLLIYLGSTFLLFSIAAWIFYTSQKHHLLDQQRETLKYHAEQIEQELRTLHKTFKSTLVYPANEYADSAIYNLNKEYIFGTGKNRELLELKEYMDDTANLYYWTKVEPWELLFYW